MIPFNSFMANGGDGVISVAANVVPSYISQICSLNLSDQFDEAKELNSILEIYMNFCLLNLIQYL